MIIKNCLFRVLRTVGRRSKSSSTKLEEHLNFLSKYYNKNLLQSILISETLISPQEMLKVKSKGTSGLSKVGVTKVDSDYSEEDKVWNEPIIYPNQVDNHSPYPIIPHPKGFDRTKLVIRFKPNKNDQKNETYLQKKKFVQDLSRDTGFDVNYISKLYVRRLLIKRVSCQTSKGKIPSYYVMTIVGDRNGTIGLGSASSREGVKTASLKLHWNAVKNLTTIDLYNNRTILGEIVFKYHAVKLFLKTAPEGFGLRVNHNIFEICQAAGIRDLKGKVFNSRNSMIVSQAFVEALKKQSSIHEIAYGRGKKAVDLKKVYYS